VVDRTRDFEGMAGVRREVESKKRRRGGVWDGDGIRASPCR